DLELRAAGADVLAERAHRRVDDGGRATNIGQLRLALDGADAVDDPVAVDDARAQRGDAGGDAVDQRRTRGRRPALDADRGRRPATLAERRADLVHGRGVVVEDGLVVVRNL